MDDAIDPDARLRAALNDANPTSAAVELARVFKAEGMGQVRMYRVYARLQEELDGDDPRYDAVVDTMDLIWGHCRKESALFEQALSEARLQAEDDA